MRKNLVALFCGACFASVLAAAEPKICTCADAKLKNEWCNPCKVGYVAGIQIKSEALFEALDAHGHTIDPAAIQCHTCKKALETDGFCDQCVMGFVSKQAYLSRLSYHLAKGRYTETAEVKCLTCKGHVQEPGWCKTCSVGMVGNVAFKDKKDYEDASKHYKLLLDAIRESARCELCAAAMITGGKCPRCKDDRDAGDK
jgi:hypothetical protein